MDTQVNGWVASEEDKKILKDSGYVEHTHDEVPADSMVVYMDDEGILAETPWESELDKYAAERKAGIKTVLVEADEIIDELDSKKVKAMPRAMRRKQMLKAKKELKHLFKELGEHAGNT